MGLKRDPDWARKLAAALDAKRHAVFAWGVCDCALFAADLVLAMTGTDPCADLRGRYHDAQGANAVLRPPGRTLEDEATARLGAPLPSVKWAQRGDVVLVGTALGPALGICLEKTVAVMSQKGLAAVPRSQGRLAWRV